MTAITTTRLRESLEGKAGFATGLRLEKEELARVRNLIKNQWRNRISQVVPEQTEAFADRGLDRYHELSHLLDHGSIWPKRERILPAAAVSEIRQMSIVKQLESELGEFTISDEEEVGYEEIYWRLVRPNASKDVGPVHADGWFWDLGHGITPTDKQRVKVWIAIYCEPGMSGLRIVPGSHLEDWPYHGEMRGGIVKPQIDFKEEDVPLELFNSQPGEAIVFHDRLLHGGAVTRGDRTRVSIEFTMFVDK